jgi:acyl-[acyl-carrier-protein]-phospholipid O-acyltransferase/long-chain-fatty-acid--[acyl-carrier-protein] ligase
MEAVNVLLHHEFVKTAKRFAKKLAIIDKTLGRDVTYGKLLIGSLILAKKIKKYKDGFIGVMIPNSIGSHLTTLGVVMAGKVPVMINYSTGAADNCRYAQDKCGFKTIITSRALLEKIDCETVPGMVFLEDLREAISIGDKLKAAVKSKLPAGLIIKSFPHAEVDDDVVILFTSGSEKEPKAVQLTHKNLGSNIKDLVTAAKFTSEDSVMSILPLFHIFGYNGNFWLPLTVGATCVSYANPLDYGKIPTFIKEDKVTVLAGTPLFLAGYLRRSEPGDFESLRLVILGADKATEQLMRGYKEKHNIEIMEGYGCTETSPAVSFNIPGFNKPGSIGRPMPSVQVKITDIDSGEELGPGKEGKILVKGDLVMKGYFDDLEETSLRIRDGWYETGDMGLMDEDGYLWHKGRLKRFVKIGGEMVSLVRTEIELERLLPEDTVCCVVEVPDSLKGARIVAAVTQEVDRKKIVKQLSGKLPPIAIPKDFVLFPELPKMGSGKVDFRTITDMVRKKLAEE